MTDYTDTIASNAFGESYYPKVSAEYFKNSLSTQVFNEVFSENFTRHDTLYIIAGTDSGLLPHYVFQQAGQGSRFIFIELQPIIDDLQQRHLLLDIDPEIRTKIRICNIDEWQANAEQFNLSGYVYTNSLQLMTSLSAAKAYLKDYIPLTTQLEKEVQETARMLKFNLGTQFFITVQLQNITDNLIRCARLKQAFANQHCVILGGGPSLDQFIDWIKQHRQRFVIIAAARVCRRLIQVNITPDIIISIDPYDISFDVSKEAYYFKNSLLVHANHCNSKLLKQWAGRAVYLGNKFPWEPKDSPQNMPVIAPTVINSAVPMAAAMGFSQIMLIGVDLCFNQYRQTHAKGSTEHEIGPQLGALINTVTTYTGRAAETIADFALAQKALSNTVTQIHGQYKTTLINLYDEAAVITGIDYLPLNKIKLADATVDASVIINRLIPKFTVEQRIEDINHSLAEIDRVTAEINIIHTLSKQALHYNNGLFGRNGVPISFHYKALMDDIEYTFDTQYKDTSSFVKMHGIREFMKMTQGDIQRAFNDDELELTAHLYYTAYVTTTANILSSLEQTKETIHQRLAEEQSPPDNISQLIAYWRKKQIPGRAKIWQQRHPDFDFSTLSPAEQVQFDQIIEEAEQRLTNHHTQHTQLIKKNRTLDNIKEEALYLFTLKNINALQTLQASLNHSPYPNTAHYNHLLSGYIAELKGEPETALQHYDDIQLDSLLELALKRMLIIYNDKNNFNKSTNVLEQLSQVAVQYKPRFAEILRLSGHTQQAINIYTDYLSQYPDDLVNLLKLGQLYQAINLPEAAQWIFTYLLEQDPHNLDARTGLLQIDKTA